MKKILLWALAIIALMLAVRNPQIQEFVQEKPKQAWLWVQAHIQGVTDYEQATFKANLDELRLSFTKREQRYVHNISKTSSDLILFYKRYCTDPETSHLVLSDLHLLSVCQVTRQTLLLE